MRKNFVIIFSVLTLAVILFAGYYMAGRKDPSSVRLRIATGGEGGIYYAFGDALANLLEKHMKMMATTIPSGGSLDNINMLRNGRADMAFVQSDIMTYAYNGTNLFSTEEPLADVYAIAGLYPEACQIVARRDITRIADLKGRRVSIGAEGSGTELNALQILESYGMGYTDINVDHLGFSASVNAFNEGKIDAFFCTAGVPTPAISQLMESGSAHILSISYARIRSIISSYPYYSRLTIPRDTYPGIEGVETVAVKAVLVVNEKLKEQTVSEMLKIMFENASEITEQATGINLNRSTATDGLSIPLHRGAEKFFFGK